MSIKIIGLAVVGAVALTTLDIAVSPDSASALTITKSASFSSIDNNITDAPIAIGQFDPSLGVLNSVLVQFIGIAQGSAGFENLSPQPSTFVTNLSNSLILKLPGGNQLSVAPFSQISTSVAGFDGIVDFGGQSGRMLSGLFAIKNAGNSYTDSSLLQALTGTGSSNLLFSAFDTSSVTGQGNGISFISTSVGANIDVTYNYTAAPAPTPVPTPALLPGLIGFGVAALRKKSQEELVAQEA